jgi:hypothetical protein
LRVFNKADRIAPETAGRIGRLYGGVCISALDSKTFPPLLAAMEKILFLQPREGFESKAATDLEGKENFGTETEEMIPGRGGESLAHL